MNKHMEVDLEELRSLMYRGNRKGINSGTALIVWGSLSFLMMEITPRFYLNYQSIGEANLYAGAFLFLLIGIGLLLDWKLTTQLIKDKDDTYDFTWKQISKVWVLMPVLGTVFTILLGTTPLGYTLFGIWVILIGAGFYLSGLFSLKLYELYGLGLMATGVLLLFIPADIIIPWGKVMAQVALSGGMIVIGIYVKRTHGW